MKEKKFTLNRKRDLPNVCPNTVRPSSPKQALRASNGFVNWINANPLCIDMPENEKKNVFGITTVAFINLEFIIKIIIL